MLVRTFGVIFFLNIVEYLLAPITTILVVKTLSVSDYGFYVFVSTLLSLIVTFCSLGLGQYNYKLIPGRQEEEQYKVLGNSLFIEVVSSLIGTSIVLLIMKAELVKYSIIAIFTCKAIFSVFNNEIFRFIGYQKKNILKSVMGFIDARFWLLPLFLFFIFNSVTVRNIFLSQIIANLLTFILFFLTLRVQKLFKYFRYDSIFSRNVLRYSLPLVLVDMGLYLQEMGSRYILKIFCSYEAIGLFSFAYSWLAIIFKFGMLSIYILQPYFSESFHKIQLGDKDALGEYRGFLKLGFKYSLIFLICGLLFFVINYATIVQFIGKTQYLETQSTIFLLSPFPIFMFLSYFCQIIMVLTNNTEALPIFYFITAGINVGLNFILVPIMGFDGSAIASTLSYIALFLLLYYRLRDNYSRIVFGNREIFKTATFIFLFLIINIISELLISQLWIRLIVYGIFLICEGTALKLITNEELAFLKKFGSV